MKGQEKRKAVVVGAVRMKTTKKLLIAGSMVFTEGINRKLRRCIW